MTCEHMHKDAPENVACEDCYTTPNYPKSITAKKTGTSKSNHSPLENSNFQKGKNSPVNLQPEGTQNLPMSCLEFEDDNTPDVEEPVQKGCGKEWKNKPGWGKGKLTFICQKGDLCPECKAEKNHSPQKDGENVKGHLINRVTGSRRAGGSNPPLSNKEGTSKSISPEVKEEIKNEEDLKEFLKDKSRDYLVGMIKGFWFKGKSCKKFTPKNHSPQDVSTRKDEGGNIQTISPTSHSEGTSKSKLRYKTYTDPKCEEKGT